MSRIILQIGSKKLYVLYNNAKRGMYSYYQKQKSRIKNSCDESLIRLCDITIISVFGVSLHYHFHWFLELDCDHQLSL